MIFEIDTTALPPGQLLQVVARTGLGARPDA